MKVSFATKVESATGVSREGGTQQAAERGRAMLKAVRALNELRLDRDLSFRALEKEMHLAGFRVHASTLLQLIRNPDARPHDRTLHKIEKFLESIYAPKAKRSARRRRSTTEVAAS